jgi:hypothetical protein
VYQAAVGGKGKGKIMLWLTIKFEPPKLSPQATAGALCCSTVVFEVTHLCGIFA